jgi:predicted extracellular nuclease
MFVMACKAQDTPPSAGVLFYNFENLYDTIDDPAKDDRIFLPASPRNWNTSKYQEKLKNLAEVISSASPKMPVIIGVCEVENENVLHDLVAQQSLASAAYSFIHFNSPDERGIDVALLYNKKHFTPKKYHPIHVSLPGDSIDYTRDILFIYGDIQIGQKKEPLNIFVNHWPSRAEGEEVSAPKRAAAAQTLKNTIDSLHATLKNPNIIIMGDFNDTPFDVSLTQILQANEVREVMPDESLVNMMSDKQKNGEGSYNFKGTWQALDQIIVSATLLDGKKLDVKANSIQYVQKDWMLFQHEKYGTSPDRTFSGNNYIGGYSDHLPVYLELIMH